MRRVPSGPSSPSSAASAGRSPRRGRTRVPRVARGSPPRRDHTSRAASGSRAKNATPLGARTGASTPAGGRGRERDPVRVEDGVAHAGRGQVRRRGADRSRTRGARGRAGARRQAPRSRAGRGGAGRGPRPGAGRAGRGGRRGRGAGQQLDAARALVGAEARPPRRRGCDPSGARLGERRLVEGQSARARGRARSRRRARRRGARGARGDPRSGARRRVVGEHRREGGETEIVTADGTPSAARRSSTSSEREVRLPERLVEPALFEGPRVLGVAHPGQVRVEHEGDVAGHAPAA